MHLLLHLADDGSFSVFDETTGAPSTDEPVDMAQGVADTGVMRRAAAADVRGPLIVVLSSTFTNTAVPDRSAEFLAELTKLTGPWQVHLFDGAAMFWDDLGLLGHVPGEAFREIGLRPKDVVSAASPDLAGLASTALSAPDVRAVGDAVRAGGFARAGLAGVTDPFVVVLDGAATHAKVWLAPGSQVPAGRHAELSGAEVANLLVAMPPVLAAIRQGRPLVLWSAEAAARPNAGQFGPDLVAQLQRSGHFPEVFGMTRGWRMDGGVPVLAQGSAFVRLPGMQAGSLVVESLSGGHPSVRGMLVEPGPGTAVPATDFTAWFSLVTPASLRQYTKPDGTAEPTPFGSAKLPVVLAVWRDRNGNYLARRRDNRVEAGSLAGLVAKALRQDKDLRRMAGTVRNVDLFVLALGGDVPVDELGEFARALAAGGYSRNIYTARGAVLLPNGMLGATGFDGVPAGEPAAVISYAIERQGRAVGQFFPMTLLEAIQYYRGGRHFAGPVQDHYERYVESLGKNGNKVVTKLGKAPAIWGQDPWMLEGHGLPGVFVAAMETGVPDQLGDVVRRDGSALAEAVFLSDIFLDAAPGPQTENLLIHCYADAPDPGTGRSMAYLYKLSWERQLRPGTVHAAPTETKTNWADGELSVNNEFFREVKLDPQDRIRVPGMVLPGDLMTEGVSFGSVSVMALMEGSARRGSGFPVSVTEESVLRDAFENGAGEAGAHAWVAHLEEGGFTIPWSGGVVEVDEFAQARLMALVGRRADGSWGWPSRLVVLSCRRGTFDGDARFRRLFGLLRALGFAGAVEFPKLPRVEINRDGRVRELADGEVAAPDSMVTGSGEGAAEPPDGAEGESSIPGSPSEDGTLVPESSVGDTTLVPASSAGDETLASEASAEEELPPEEVVVRSLFEQLVLVSGEAAAEEMLARLWVDVVANGADWYLEGTPEPRVVGWLATALRGLPAADQERWRREVVHWVRLPEDASAEELVRLAPAYQAYLDALAFIASQEGSGEGLLVRRFSPVRIEDPEEVAAHLPADVSEPSDAAQREIDALFADADAMRRAAGGSGAPGIRREASTRPVALTDLLVDDVRVRDVDWVALGPAGAYGMGFPLDADESKVMRRYVPDRYSAVVHRGEAGYRVKAKGRVVVLDEAGLAKLLAGWGALAAQGAQAGVVLVTCPRWARPGMGALESTVRELGYDRPIGVRGTGPRAELLPGGRIRDLADGETPTPGGVVLGDPPDDPAGRKTGGRGRAAGDGGVGSSRSGGGSKRDARAVEDPAGGGTHKRTRSEAAHDDGEAGPADGGPAVLRQVWQAEAKPGKRGPWAVADDPALSAQLFTLADRLIEGARDRFAPPPVRAVFHGKKSAVGGAAANDAWRTFFEKKIDAALAARGSAVRVAQVGLTVDLVSRSSESVPEPWVELMVGEGQGERIDGLRGASSVMLEHESGAARVWSSSWARLVRGVEGAGYAALAGLAAGGDARLADVSALAVRPSGLTEKAKTQLAGWVESRVRWGLERVLAAAREAVRAGRPLPGGLAADRLPSVDEMMPEVQVRAKSTKKMARPTEPGVTVALPRRGAAEEPVPGADGRAMAEFFAGVASLSLLEEPAPADQGSRAAWDSALCHGDVKLLQASVAEKDVAGFRAAADRIAELVVDARGQGPGTSVVKEAPVVKAVFHGTPNLLKRSIPESWREVLTELVDVALGERSAGFTAESAGLVIDLVKSEAKDHKGPVRLAVEAEAGPGQPVAGLRVASPVVLEPVSDLAIQVRGSSLGRVLWRSEGVGAEVLEAFVARRVGEARMPALTVTMARRDNLLAKGAAENADAAEAEQVRDQVRRQARLGAARALAAARARAERDPSWLSVDQLPSLDDFVPEVEMRFVPVWTKAERATVETRAEFAELPGAQAGVVPVADRERAVAAFFAAADEAGMTEAMLTEAGRAGLAGLPSAEPATSVVAVSRDGRREVWQAETKPHPAVDSVSDRGGLEAAIGLVADELIERDAERREPPPMSVVCHGTRAVTKAVAEEWTDLVEEMLDAALAEKGHPGLSVAALGLWVDVRREVEEGVVPRVGLEVGGARRELLGHLRSSAVVPLRLAPGHPVRVSAFSWARLLRRGEGAAVEALAAFAACGEARMAPVTVTVTREQRLAARVADAEAELRAEVLEQLRWSAERVLAGAKAKAARGDLGLGLPADRLPSVEDLLPEVRVRSEVVLGTAGTMVKADIPAPGGLPAGTARGAVEGFFAGLEAGDLLGGRRPGLPAGTQRGVPGSKAAGLDPAVGEMQGAFEADYGDARSPRLDDETLALVREYAVRWAARMKEFAVLGQEFPPTRLHVKQKCGTKADGERLFAAVEGILLEEAERELGELRSARRRQAGLGAPEVTLADLGLGFRRAWSLDRRKSELNLENRVEAVSFRIATLPASGYTLEELEALRETPLYVSSSGPRVELSPSELFRVRRMVAGWYARRFSQDGQTDSLLVEAKPMPKANWVVVRRQQAVRAAIETEVRRGYATFGKQVSASEQLPVDTVMNDYVRFETVASTGPGSTRLRVVPEDAPGSPEMLDEQLLGGPGPSGWGAGRVEELPDDGDAEMSGTDPSALMPAGQDVDWDALDWDALPDWDALDGNVPPDWDALAGDALELFGQSGVAPAEGTAHQEFLAGVDDLYTADGFEGEHGRGLDRPSARMAGAEPGSDPAGLTPQSAERGRPKGSGPESAGSPGGLIAAAVPPAQSGSGLRMTELRDADRGDYGMVFSTGQQTGTRIGGGKETTQVAAARNAGSGVPGPVAMSDLLVDGIRISDVDHVVLGPRGDSYGMAFPLDDRERSVMARHVPEPGEDRYSVVLHRGQAGYRVKANGRVVALDPAAFTKLLAGLGALSAARGPAGLVLVTCPLWALPEIGTLESMVREVGFDHPVRVWGSASRTELLPDGRARDVADDEAPTEGGVILGSKPQGIEKKRLKAKPEGSPAHGGPGRAGPGSLALRLKRTEKAAGPSEDRDEVKDGPAEPMDLDDADLASEDRGLPSGPGGGPAGLGAAALRVLQQKHSAGEKLPTRYGLMEAVPGLSAYAAQKVIKEFRQQNSMSGPSRLVVPEAMREAAWEILAATSSSGKRPGWTSLRGQPGLIGLSRTMAETLIAEFLAENEDACGEQGPTVTDEHRQTVRQMFADALSDGVRPPGWQRVRNETGLTEYSARRLVTEIRKETSTAARPRGVVSADQRATAWKMFEAACAAGQPLPGWNLLEPETGLSRVMADRLVGEFLSKNPTAIRPGRSRRASPQQRAKAWQMFTEAAGKPLPGYRRLMAATKLSRVQADDLVAEFIARNPLAIPPSGEWPVIDDKLRAKGWQILADARDAGEALPSWSRLWRAMRVTRSIGQRLRWEFVVAAEQEQDATVRRPPPAGGERAVPNIKRTGARVVARPALDRRLDNEFPYRSRANPGGAVEEKYADETGGLHPNVTAGADHIWADLLVGKRMLEGIARDPRDRRLPASILPHLDRFISGMEQSVAAEMRRLVLPTDPEYVPSVQSGPLTAEHLPVGSSRIGQNGTFLVERPSSDQDVAKLPSLRNGRILKLYLGAPLRTPEQQSEWEETYEHYPNYTITVPLRGGGKIQIAAEGAANAAGLADTAVVTDRAGKVLGSLKLINSVFLPFAVRMPCADGTWRWDTVAALVGLDNLFDPVTNPHGLVIADYGDEFDLTFTPRLEIEPEEDHDAEGEGDQEL
ncbi:hypothetical protein ACFXPA_41405 [Amycolatopsis sp. NPDC059090]|uniref:hypothetical protein n=1 Tax=Amycolatopsis sp. NPDC059090 TaxID=3346723 RepID=UPI00366FD50A